MIKKIIVFILLFILSVNYSFAVTLTPVPTDEPREDSKSKIDDLKERVASRVAQLNLVEKRGLLGTASEIENTQITMSDLNGDTRYVDIDELTKILSSSGKAIGISDIEKGDVIAVLGLYNKQSKRILAREIKNTIVPRFGTGVVVSADDKEFTIDVIDENKKVTLDVEKITKTYSYLDKSGLKSSGFSQIAIGNNIVYAGYSNKDKKISATKVIVFPDIPTNPSIEIPVDALSKDDEIISSTGSGKKLTPIKK